MKRLGVLCMLCVSLLATAQRLPNIVLPEYYRLKFTPDFKTDQFGGEEAIRVRVTAPTKTISLNAVDLTLQDVTVASQGSASPQKATVTMHPESEMATLEVPQTVPAGSAEIRINFSGTLNTRLRGLYLSKAGGRKYAVTQFEPTDARRAFPSFDEPAYKAVFDISVVAPAGNTAISNGRIIADQPGPGPNVHTIRFGTTPKMSTYLVAVLIGDFQCIEGAADGIPMRVCTVPGQQELGRFALSAAESFMHYFNQYFGIKYPYGKLDLIGIPDFEAGAMENVGAITFRDIALLADPKQASVGQLKEIALVVSHEMAHQWFGDLVTMKWWNDIWLNEGFATWMENKPVAAWKPEWHLEMEEQESADAAMNTDSLENTRPIRQPAESPAQINELFDAIAYQKTAAVLRMVEAYLGPDVFRQGINKYLAAHSYANATAEDFSGAVSSVANKPVDRILASFVNQPGVPVIGGHVNCAIPPSVTLSQRRFTYSGTASAPQRWSIPLCFGHPGSAPGPASDCVLLEQPEQTFKSRVACDAEVTDWNVGARGYYRIAYAAAEVPELARVLARSFPPVGRLALLDNEWALVRAGQHGSGDFLTLAQGLKDDRSAAVVSDLVGTLDFITDYLVDADDRQAYQRWVRSLFGPEMQQVGWTASSNDDDERRQLRRALFEGLGYSGRDPQAFAHAKNLLQRYLLNPAAVDPTLLGVVFRLSAMQGDATLYDEFVSRSKTAKTPEVYYRYLYALSDFTDPALLKRTLEYALGPDVRGQDAPILIAQVIGNPAGRQLAWQFVQTHWNDIQQKASFYGSTIIAREAGALCDATARQQVQAFFADHKVQGAERSLRQTLERIQNCVQLKTAQQPNLESWLKGNAAAGE